MPYANLDMIYKATGQARVRFWDKLGFTRSLLESNLLSQATASLPAQ